MSATKLSAAPMDGERVFELLAEEMESVGQSENVSTIESLGDGITKVRGFIPQAAYAFRMGGREKAVQALLAAAAYGAFTLARYGVVAQDWQDAGVTMPLNNTTVFDALGEELQLNRDRERAPKTVGDILLEVDRVMGTVEGLYTYEREEGMTHFGINASLRQLTRVVGLLVYGIDALGLPERPSVPQHSLLFLNPVQQPGTNLTVRRGTKWFKNANRGDRLNIFRTGDEENKVATATVIDTMLFPFDMLKDEHLQNEHDESCRTVAGLTEAMERAYPDFDQTEVVTLLFYHVEPTTEQAVSALTM